jgi:hypothetical protein
VATIFQPSGRTARSRTSDTTPAIATGTGTSVGKKRARLPDEVRDNQDGGNHNSRRHAPGGEDVAPPAKERRDKHDQDDGERELRLQSATSTTHRNVTSPRRILVTRAEHSLLTRHGGCFLHQAAKSPVLHAAARRPRGCVTPGV